MYPRVLVIDGEPFWKGSATGLTKSSLFHGWPHDRLASLYITSINPDKMVCELNWQLQTKNLRYLGSIGRLIDSILMEKINQRNTFNNNNKVVNSNISESMILKRLWYVRKRLAGQSLRDLDIYKIPDRILMSLSKYNPQIIYSLLGSNPLLKLVVDVADFFNIPIIPHFMDDWPSTLYSNSIFKSYLRRNLHTRLAVLLNHAPIRMVIGEDMAVEYNRRYGGINVSFMIGVEPRLLESTIMLSEPRKKIKLVYVGGLHLNRWYSLQRIAEALQSLSLEGLETEAFIYTQPRFEMEAKKLNIHPVMRFMGSLSPDHVYDVLQDADILLHVESFDSAQTTYTRYSISSKIPESMSTGRPIFAYGPNTLASIRYIENSGAGLIVGIESQEKLKATLRKLITSHSLRSELGANGFRTAKNRHNAVKNRGRFRDLIESVAFQKNAP